MLVSSAVLPVNGVVGVVVGVDIGVDVGDGVVVDVALPPPKSPHPVPPYESSSVNDDSAAASGDATSSPLPLSPPLPQTVNRSKELLVSAIPVVSRM